MSVSAYILWTQIQRCTVGAVVEGASYAINVDGAGYSHTAAPGESAPDIAAALAVAIGERATSSGPAVDVSEATPGVPSLVTVGPRLTLSTIDVGPAAELKAQMRITGTALDDSLRGWLAAACALADAYLRRDYASLAEIPAPVRIGCYQAVRVFRDAFDQFEGVNSARNQDRAENYVDGYIGDRARRAGEALWYPFAAEPDLVRGPR